MKTYLYYDLKYPKRFGPFLELWTDINDFEGIYKVSDYGRISSAKNGILKCNKDITGYVGVTLHSAYKKRRVSVHILVCENFIPNPELKPCVNHKLGFRHQNFVGELEWVTYSENSLHAFRVLKAYTNQNNHMKKLIYIHRDGEIKTWLGIRNTARMLNIPYQGIQAVLKGKMNIYKGYYFSQDNTFIAQENITGIKICNKCNIEKAISEFHKSAFLTMNTCKKCRNELLRIKRLSN